MYEYYVTAVNEHGECLESEGIQVSAVKEDGNGEENGGWGPWIAILLIMINLLLIGCVVGFILVKKKKQDDGIVDNQYENTCRKIENGEIYKHGIIKWS